MLAAGPSGILAKQETTLVSKCIIHSKYNTPYSGAYSTFTYSYTMLYPCLVSRATLSDQDTLSLLVQRVGGWLSILPDLSVRYWVPEDRVYLLYLIDPLLEPLPRLDYIDHRDHAYLLQRGQ